MKFSKEWPDFKNNISGVDGAPISNHSSVMPASLLADSNACRRAKMTTTLMQSGGSPVAKTKFSIEWCDSSLSYKFAIPFERRTPPGLELFFKNVIRKSIGMSLGPGGLYVHVRLVKSCPFS